MTEFFLTSGIAGAVFAAFLMGFAVGFYLALSLFFKPPENLK